MSPRAFIFSNPQDLGKHKNLTSRPCSERDATHWSPTPSVCGSSEMWVTRRGGYCLMQTGTWSRPDRSDRPDHQRCVSLITRKTSLSADIPLMCMWSIKEGERNKD